MSIHLTPEQEERVKAVVSRGAYDSPEEVVEAALAVIEQSLAPPVAGAGEELDALLAEGLASHELSEERFWNSVNHSTDAMLADHKARTGK